MDIRYLDVWRTLPMQNNSSEYLYHYTNIYKAIKILASKKLFFSPLTELNDTCECKIRLAFDYYSDLSEGQRDAIVKKLDSVIKYLNENAQLVKILCFSMAEKVSDRDGDFWRNYGQYQDMTGRGYAMPRMWAQYAQNNTGVCLIFDKKKLLDEVIKSNPILHKGAVDYKDYYSRYQIQNEKVLDIILDCVDQREGKLVYLDSKEREKYELETLKLIFKYLENCEDFIHYNYFSKLKDWENEREYRLLTLSTKSHSPTVGNIENYLMGIVVGEKNDQDYTIALKNLLKNKNILIKQIQFNEKMIILKE